MTIDGICTITYLLVFYNFADGKWNLNSKVPGKPQRWTFLAKSCCQGQEATTAICIFLPYPAQIL